MKPTVEELIEKSKNCRDRRSQYPKAVRQFSDPFATNQYFLAEKK
jgi:hypothetical protein